MLTVRDRRMIKEDMMDVFNEGVHGVIFPVLETMMGDIKVIKKDIVEIKEDIVEIRGYIVEIREDVDEIRGDIDEMNGRLTIVEKRQEVMIDEFRSRDDNHEKRIRKLEVAIAS
jgi:uncharacterized coiled-coil DUF342 family protein